MNDLLGRSPSDTNVNKLNVNGSNITSEEENAFNEYFTNIGPNLANSILKITANTIAPSLTHIFNQTVFHTNGKWHDLYQSTKKNHGI